jgi:hypothetical protein
MSEEIKDTGGSAPSGHTPQGGDKRGGLNRRDMLMGLATVPVLGVFFYKLGRKQAVDEFKKNQILAEMGMEKKAPAVLPKTTMKKAGQLVRVGIIGYGGRGENVIRAAGFAHPEWIEQKKIAEKETGETSLKDYLAQEDLNIAITGVCDAFDIRADRGVAASEVDPLGGRGEEARRRGEVPHLPGTPGQSRYRRGDHRHAGTPARPDGHRRARRREACLLRSAPGAHGRGRAGDCRRRQGRF